MIHDVLRPFNGGNIIHFENVISPRCQSGKIDSAHAVSFIRKWMLSNESALIKDQRAGKPVCCQENQENQKCGRIYQNVNERVKPYAILQRISLLYKVMNCHLGL